MHFPTARIFLLAFMLLTCCSRVVVAQQTFKVAKIEFEGLQRQSADEMIAASNLKIGQTFELESLDAAAQRLMDSGFFKNVAYRTHADHDQITITFQVEEMKGGDSVVVFDNFVWFTDEEIASAVRRDVPAFNGRAPDNGSATVAITRALQRLLVEHELKGTVEYMPSQDSPNSPVQEHVFSIAGISLPVCKLHFPGAKNVSETKLIENSKGLLGAEYSRKFSSLFAVSNLFPIYRALGQLRATFAPPSATPESNSTCRSGVELTIPVDEGPIYNWDKADWSGISAFTSQELDVTLGMKRGEPANGLVFDKGYIAVQKAYGRKGYLMSRIRARPEFDDTAQEVGYKMEVTEGPQYKMGKFTFKGISESVAKALSQEWKLKSGDVFDQGYPMEFSQKQMGQILRSTFEERRAQGKPAPNIKMDLAPNREALTVDVVYQITN